MDLAGNQRARCEVLRRHGVLADGMNQVILFGGADQTKVYGDTWKWNFLTKAWTCLSGC